MPYNLGRLKNNHLSAIFNSEEGQKMRNSDSLYEKAAFLFRWAAEWYPYFVSRFKLIFPKASVNLKSNIIRMA